MELLSRELLANIGMIAIAGGIILALMLSIGLLFAYIISRNRNVVDFLSSKFGSVIIRILLVISDLLYIPSKKTVSLLGGNDSMIDIVGIELRNMLLKKRFAEVPYKDRVVILPQCLRDLNCPAKFSSIEGARCTGCGKCKIFNISKKADELGYKGAYIAPGGGFVKRIIKKAKPKAVLGVGCPYEVNWGMLEISDKGLPCQGVILLGSGCVGTDVDLEEVFTVMEMLSCKHVLAASSGDMP